MLHLPQTLGESLNAFVQQDYPCETCGLLLGVRMGDEHVVSRVRRAHNLNIERAEDRYELDPDDFLAADRARMIAPYDYRQSAMRDDRPRPLRKVSAYGFDYLQRIVVAGLPRADGSMPRNRQPARLQAGGEAAGTHRIRSCLTTFVSRAFSASHTDDLDGFGDLRENEMHVVHPLVLQVRP